MDNNYQLIDSWVFEYLAHKYLKRYFEEGCNSAQLRQDYVLGVLTSHLSEEHDSFSRKEYVCLLFLHLLCMEESLADDDSQTDCDYITTDNFKKSLPQHIAFATRDSDSDSIRKLARNCLIQTYATVYKYCLRNDTDWKEALDDFSNFVTLMPSDECKEVYEKCAKISRVEPNDDFISEYLDLIRHLVLTLYSDFEEPYLIKLAQTRESNDEKAAMDINQDERQNSKDETENGPESQQSDAFEDRITSELRVLLKDTRPSKASDLREIKLEESNVLSKIRKKAEDFDSHKHVQNIIRLEKRIKRKPLSHQNVRAGPWMLEEVTAFIEKTLEIGVGKWVEIKKALNTFRSCLQLKDKWRTIKQWQIDEVKRERKKKTRSSR